ncbi:Adenine deaminase [Apiospora arundinis]
MGPKTVVIEGSQISQEGEGDTSNNAGDDGSEVIDATGCTLLPGLIDCHVHIRDEDQLASCASFGVTTVCDMAGIPPKTFQLLRAGSTHAWLFWMGGMGSRYAIHDVEEAACWVQDRVAQDEVDYLKVIADVPGHDQAVLDRIQQEAARHKKMTVAHATHLAAFPAAYTRASTSSPTSRSTNRSLRTLCAEWQPKARVELMREAGVPILAGTDSNNSGIATVSVGTSLHHELKLLVNAGLDPVQALRAATSLAAEHFALPDRGWVKPGMRADLVLVEGNPIEDISATQNIRKVWSGGQAVAPAKVERGSSICQVM